MLLERFCVVIEPFLMSLPVISDLAATADPDIAKTTAMTATIIAGEFFSFRNNPCIGDLSWCCQPRR